MHRELDNQSLPLFFKQLLDQAIKQRKLELRNETQSYLVHMLQSFVHTEATVLKESETLAGLFLKASQDSSTQSIPLFRRVGDIALYTSGFFSDSLNRKLVDVDYYIALGGSAYQSVTARLRDEQLSVLYNELAQKFLALVQILSHISEERQLTNNADIMRLYERWLRTGDSRLYDQLVKHGITPNSTIKTDKQ